jgi:hypothetical protein
MKKVGNNPTNISSLYLVNVVSSGEKSKLSKKRIKSFCHLKIFLISLKWAVTFNEEKNRPKNAISEFKFIVSPV